MRRSEKFFLSIRHSAKLSELHWLWNAVRPMYDSLSNLTSRKGLERIVNGTDRILIAPAVRDLAESYEPEVWHCLMGEARKGYTVADVGAFRGVYAIALANRIGESGRVIAFEPDPLNFSFLTKHIALNAVSDRVEAIQAAVGETEGYVSFSSNLSESHVTQSAGPNQNGGNTVRCITLDSVFANQAIDLMKIDVEGYEEMVLKGAARLLADPSRKPRAIFVEVHPFAWEETGTTSNSLLELLRSAGYDVLTLEGTAVDEIREYGEIVAWMRPETQSASRFSSTDTR